ncbi:MAG: glucosidase, partial [Myxococcales bacterium]|nr:glucosidase [Myxococcales bacterium]
MMMTKQPNTELQRLATEGERWKAWGPYLSERQWGTVREDYSPHGNAWEYFPHDHARSRAYRWGEDGIGGFSDSEQRLCVALGLWNGADPILKERLFGLTNSEGNHGEDVKEQYYYLDATPTHSYARMLYKYPQRAFPYQQLAEVNQQRSIHEPELELLDTGIFDDDRYFDVDIEYAQAEPQDLLLRVTVSNRGPEKAEIHILPHVWFRNTWSWTFGAERPHIRATSASTARAEHAKLGIRAVAFDGSPDLLFCENETDPGAVHGAGTSGGSFKNAIGRHVIHGDPRGLKNDGVGTKLAAHYRVTVEGGGRTVVRMRLSEGAKELDGQAFDAIVDRRRGECDEFFRDLQTIVVGEDRRRVQRQAFAGLIWTKQFYHFDIPQWLNGDEAQPPPPSQRRGARNADWVHLNNAEVISMPDTWEYPWYAAWDLAFHCIPFALIDASFAKEQLILLTREWYMHPNGQIPAYEWAFGDVNPPVHAWAAWRVFQIDRKNRGDEGDIVFLERVFHKLLLNFTWWVNRKDAHGNHVFQGGFLGLDNIGVFDRSAPLPTGGHLDQSDGTAWMAMYCLNLMRISLELALHNRTYEDIATKFFEHFLYIAKAMNAEGGHGFWDEGDRFYYDSLDLPSHDGKRRSVPLRVRSMVGLISLFAVETLEPSLLDRLPDFRGRLEWFLNYRPDLKALVSHWEVPGQGQRRLLSLLRGSRM